ncbi:glycosyltransferase family 2 protein [Microgenomates group bacterium]|nr:glycosyltransferase family 2 protein [Microgenomates group bacterium]
MISVVLATHNEEKNLPSCLDSIKDFADEIIIADGESSDQTLSIAKKYGAKTVKTTNKPNFHINKQLAIDAAKGDLILQLDADEHVDSELKKFIVTIHQTADHTYSAWWLKRQNFFLGRWMKRGGLYPDPVIRLFWRGEAWLPQKDVHEQMAVKNDNVGWAFGHLLHFSYPVFDSYITKFNTYTTFKALQLKEARLKRSWHVALSYILFKPWGTFFLMYVRHRGFRDGLAGFIFALGSSWHHPIAYLKYCEMTKKK